MIVRIFFFISVFRYFVISLYRDVGISGFRDFVLIPTGFACDDAAAVGNGRRDATEVAAP